MTGLKLCRYVWIISFRNIPRHSTWQVSSKIVFLHSIFSVHRIISASNCKFIYPANCLIVGILFPIIILFGVFNDSAKSLTLRHFLPLLLSYVIEYPQILHIIVINQHLLRWLEPRNHYFGNARCLINKHLEYKQNNATKAWIVKSLATK